MVRFSPRNIWVGPRPVAVYGCPFWGQKTGLNRTCEHYQQVSPNNRNDEWWTWFTPPNNSSELYDLICFFFCKIDSLLCFSLFRIIFCLCGTRQTLCHHLSSRTILMHPHCCLQLSFLQVPLIWTSHLLTLAHLHRTPSISNEMPVPRQSKRYRVPSSDKESKVEIVEPARVLSNTVLVGPVRISFALLSRFLTYYFSFSLVSVVIC